MTYPTVAIKVSASAVRSIKVVLGFDGEEHELSLEEAVDMAHKILWAWPHNDENPEGEAPHDEATEITDTGSMFLGALDVGLGLSESTFTWKKEKPSKGHSQKETK